MVTPQVFVAVFVWSSILHFADLRNNPFVQVPERLLGLFIATAVTFAAIWLLPRLWLPRVAQMSVWKWMLATAVLATAIRGVAFSGWLRWIEYPTLASLFVRGTASIYSVLFGVLASTIALGVIRTHAATRARLIAEQHRLRIVRQRAVEQLHDLDEGLAETIKSDLHQAIGDISNLEGSAVLSKLRETIDDVVRPLSHYLQERSAKWDAPSVSAAELTVHWGDVLRAGLRVDRIMPLTNTAFLVIAGVPTLAQRYQLLPTALTAVAGLLLGVATFSALKSGMRRISCDWGDAAQAVGFVATLVVSGFVLGLAALPLTLSEGQPFSMVWIAILFTPLGGILVSLAVTGTHELEKVDEQLEQATTDLAWETARTRAFYRQRQRALTHALHGQVQASLAAAYLRLKPLAEDTMALAEELPQVIEDLHEVVDHISTEPEQVEDCREVVAKVAANWAGVAEVTFQISPEAEFASSTDTLARTVLVDLIPELSFNAVKHGSAKSIQISVDLVDDRTLRLTACDNGTGLKLAGRQGLGTALLEECTVKWGRKANPAGRGTCVSADIPTFSERPTL